MKLINANQANHIVKDANCQGIKECSHVFVNEFVEELSPGPPDEYVTQGAITSDEVEIFY